MSATFMNETIENPKLFFYYLRSFVFSTGRLSQMLWPTQNRNGNKIRAERLRERACIGEDFYLKENKFRNDLAHFDERLDRWCRQSPKLNLVRGSIMQRGGIGGTGLDQQTDFLEVFFTDEKVAVFASTEFNVQQAFDDVRRIKSLVDDAVQS